MTVKVSSVSNTPSSMIGTEKVCVLLPAGKLSVPLVAVKSSDSAVSLPPMEVA